MKVMEDLTDITNHYKFNEAILDNQSAVTFTHEQIQIAKLRFYKEYIEPLNEIAIVEIQKLWNN